MHPCRHEEGECEDEIPGDFCLTRYSEDVVDDK